MQTLLDRFDALLARFDAELGPLADALLDAEPADGGWTGRQILGHLTITARLYDERIRAAIARRPEGGKPTTKPHKPGWFAGLLLKWLPDLAKRFKSPKKFDPRHSEERFDVEELCRVHRGLRATAQQIAERHLGAFRFGTPVSPLLRLSMHDGIQVMVLHGERHLVQLRRVVGLPALEGPA